MAVHFNHFNRLLVLDDNVFQKVFVFFVKLDKMTGLGCATQTEQFFHNNVVATERGGEVGQRFLQVQKVEQLRVLHGLTQMFFQFVSPANDDTDVFQV